MAFPTIKLAFIACSLFDPKACQEHELRYSAEATDVTPMQCMQGAQAQLAEWFKGHPNVRITRYSCALDRGEVAKI